MMHQTLRNPSGSVWRKAGYTMLEMAVTTSIIATAFGILMPAISQSKQSAAQTQCQLNAKFITHGVLHYATDHNNVTVPDLRKPGYRISGGHKIQSTDLPSESPPKDATDRRRSWFGQIETAYLGGELDRVDCPVVNNHRRLNYESTWPTDYSISQYGINVSVDAAEQPSRNVLIGEPNMSRAFVTRITSCVAYYIWWGPGGSRDDLEQNKAGSLSFGFADGHAARVAIPAVKLPFFNEPYPQLFMQYETPQTDGIHAHENKFTWYKAQQWPPPPNDLTDVSAY
ncbi:MAG: type II secretion system protein [Phycisphaeraceae bacterium]|nr:type II secretion system protein [Phycisphaeraceae bacterium]